jgi:hypothetical protein
MAGLDAKSGPASIAKRGRAVAIQGDIRKH